MLVKKNKAKEKNGQDYTKSKQISTYNDMRILTNILTIDIIIINFIGKFAIKFNKEGGRFHVLPQLWK